MLKGKCRSADGTAFYTKLKGEKVMNSNKNPRLPGEVTVWKMTEEQRQAYIKKHPIVPSDEHLKYWDWDGGKKEQQA